MHIWLPISLSVLVIRRTLAPCHIQEHPAMRYTECLCLFHWWEHKKTYSAYLLFHEYSHSNLRETGKLNTRSPIYCLKDDWDNSLHFRHTLETECTWRDQYLQIGCYIFIPSEFMAYLPILFRVHSLTLRQPYGCKSYDYVWPVCIMPHVLYMYE